MPSSEYASVRALKEGIQIENMVMGIVRGNGQITWLNVSATPVPLEGYGVAIVYNDITANWQAREELRLKNIELHTANIEKDKFFSIIAHDLRSPFTNLLGFTQVMVEELDTLILFVAAKTIRHYTGCSGIGHQQRDCNQLRYSGGFICFRR